MTDRDEDYVLANAPEFVESMNVAENELATGATRPLGVVAAEIERTEPPEPGGSPPA